LVQRFERKWRDCLCGQEEVSEYELMTEATCYRFSGVARHEGCIPQELIQRVLEGVARKEGYWAEKPVEWNVKPRPSHMELPS
jgi:hypothetical protein